VKSGILNAYYLPLPTRGSLLLDHSVNSFRLVFNLYFGTELELLATSTPTVFRWQVHRRDERLQGPRLSSCSDVGSH